jgi:hypothetical protein
MKMKGGKQGSIPYLLDWLIIDNYKTTLHLCSINQPLLEWAFSHDWEIEVQPTVRFIPFTSPSVPFLFDALFGLREHLCHS